jgi:hypothetical protein
MPLAVPHHPSASLKRRHDGKVQGLKIDINRYGKFPSLPVVPSPYCMYPCNCPSCSMLGYTQPRIIFPCFLHMHRVISLKYFRNITSYSLRKETPLHPQRPCQSTKCCPTPQPASLNGQVPFHGTYACELVAPVMFHSEVTTEIRRRRDSVYDYITITPQDLTSPSYIADIRIQS